MEDDEPIYEIKIYIKFHKIGHVDTKQQQFAATIEVRATWRIPLIPSQAAVATFLARHDHERHIGFQLTEEEQKIFEDIVPRLQILNLEDTRKEKSVYRYNVRKQEQILDFDLRWHLKGIFHEQMELHDFPFDVQDLCIRLYLDDRSKERFYLEVGEIPGILNDKAFQDHQEWVLFKMVQTGENNVDEDSSVGSDDLLVLRCNVQRKFKYFVYNCFLVMLFFAIMSLCNFANTPQFVQFRLSGTLTLVLTSVAYKLMLSNTLPTISYLTLVDIYVLFAILMLTILVVAFASLHALFRTSSLEGEEKDDYFWTLDLYTMTVVGTIYFIWNVSFGLLAFYKIKSVSRKLRKEEQLYIQKLVQTNRAPSKLNRSMSARFKKMSIMVSRLERESSHASQNENATSANSLHQNNESRYPPEQHHQDTATPSAKANRVEPAVLKDDPENDDTSSLDDRVGNLRKTFKKQSHIPPASLPQTIMMDTNSDFT